MKQKAGSVLDMGEATEFELEHMRRAMVEREGLLADIFSVLRSVPRCVPWPHHVSKVRAHLQRVAPYQAHYHGP